MKAAGNILVLTQWSFNDALVQTYTLPYIDIIREILSPERKIILVTAEQPDIALSKDETNEINKDWAKKNMQLLPEPYNRFGLKKLMASAGNLSKFFPTLSPFAPAIVPLPSGQGRSSPSFPPAEKGRRGRSGHVDSMTRRRSVF